MGHAAAFGLGMFIGVAACVAWSAWQLAALYDDGEP